MTNVLYKLNIILASLNPIGQCTQRPSFTILRLIVRKLSCFQDWLHGLMTGPLLLSISVFTARAMLALQALY